MNRGTRKVLLSRLLLVSLIGCCFQAVAIAQLVKDSVSTRIVRADQINPTTVELIFTDNHRLTVDFYGNNIFRVFEDIHGGILRDPEAKPPAQILVDNPRRDPGPLTVSDASGKITIRTDAVEVAFSKNGALLSVVDRHVGKEVITALSSIEFGDNSVGIQLKENPNEYFYGGGVQNGRFSHKGRRIAIENQNSWTDGGVASPTPFYWSTQGYGVMFYTFRRGSYDFGAKTQGVVQLSHETDYFDAFFMVDQDAVNLLNDFYQLTGNPVLLPKFAFYEGHLNAYNRDYWKEDTAGILFEDGKRYKESQKDNGGIKESLNGEKSNYQFSARAVIDRYAAHDMPLGWLLPNDGYGAGYGQTSTLDSNIANLRSLGDYARSKGVEIGLWTQSDLHPKEGVSALLQRDIVKEVRDAGVRVLKTDVAWVGAGYSFGLNGVADVGHILPYYGKDARPFIISLDGWAGTQRYASVWSGDQTGGNWEYIRFHIPTFIGSGLSGQPNITSDMDGIFGGKNPVVLARGFEWKTFTPMQLNMDGWGANEKYPHALGEPTTSINRTYLKLKSELIPYTYSLAHEAVTGLPMVRAMFLHDPNEYTLGRRTQYQFMYGPSFLVAPIYESTQMDSQGNDIRNNIYLPEGLWVDYFTGLQYQGGVVLNSFDAPIWKLPVFVKRGAIIPMANPNNHVQQIDHSQRIYELYPYGNSAFEAYEDDGKTQAYLYNEGVKTLIESNQKGEQVLVKVHPTKGEYKGFVKEKATIFKVNVTKAPKTVTVRSGKDKIKLSEVKSQAAFDNGTDVYFYNPSPNLNQFATPGSEFEKVAMIKNPQIWVKTRSMDVTQNELSLEIKGFEFNPTDPSKVKTGSLAAPTGLHVADSNNTAYTLGVSWQEQAAADYYEIEFEDVVYTHIKGNYFNFDQLTPETEYTFKIRAVNQSGQSDWATLQEKTKKNPLEFALQQVTARSTARDQGRMGVQRLFDFDEGNDWHTAYDTAAVPFDIIVDLHSVNTLDKIQYLPRISGRNGILTKGKFYTSLDKNTWTEAGTFTWKADNQTKEFSFQRHPQARYVKVAVEAGVGNFGSGREMYIFKVPGSESYLPGDINNDHKIDRNDLTSYMNYTGLRLGDGDFEGYISNGDINKNNLIDAYDISVVATQLEGGVRRSRMPVQVSGSLEVTADKKQVKTGESVHVLVSGKDLKDVNALSLAIEYNNQDFDYVGIQTINVGEMENLTNDRLHTDGSKVLYPTFVNLGQQPRLSGSSDLFTIELKAKRNVTLDLKATELMLVDQQLNFITAPGAKIEVKN